ncbi:cilia- and flagella-associated protein 77-like isoform X1 [Mya arenaria]|uniref:cilia- and flagella-associated protein 77-like isoform X1 n=1 Tax=Mya arenaria TaxID=6604 RepID=UPI0022E6926A|nr:cilia- and flagella-associated protein 77-like isoform X1 [Mya arenaria]
MAADTLSLFESPYKYTAAGELGINRDTMLQNELLLRTELGKPKRRGVIIPAGTTYGRPNGMRDGGSSEALHGWPTISSSTLPFKRKEKASQRDFMALNRAAVSAGLVTANAQYEFRATHDVRGKTTSEEGQRNRTRRMPPSMVYGISTRPSTPIFDLLEHKYQDKWLQERRKLELAKRQEESKMGRYTHSAGVINSAQKRSPGQVYETRATLLRTYQNPVDPDPLWQMPKFKNNAQPSLQTFRSGRARTFAYDNFESDMISRKGNLGHGTYESAKN